MTGHFRQARNFLGGFSLILVGGLLLAQAGTGRVVAQAATTVQTSSGGALGTILADSAGKTLYVFDRDTAGVSNCNDACAQTWPPLELATGTPTMPADVTGKLAVITRADGKRQVTYQDRPLYHFASDAAAGDTKGEGVGGIWHVAKPAAVTTTAAPAAAAPAAAPAAASAAAPAAAPAAARPVALAAAGTGGLIGTSGEHPLLSALLVAAALGMAALGMALFMSGRRLDSRR